MNSGYGDRNTFLFQRRTYRTQAINHPWKQHDREALLIPGLEDTAGCAVPRNLMLLFQLAANLLFLDKSQLGD